MIATQSHVLPVLQHVRKFLANPSVFTTGEYARGLHGSYVPYWQLEDLKMANGYTARKAIQWSITGAVLLYCEVHNLDPRPVQDALGDQIERINDAGHEQAMWYLDHVIQSLQN